MVVQPCKYTKKPLNCTFKRLSFVICELYINKKLYAKKKKRIYENTHVHVRLCKRNKGREKLETKKTGYL